MRGQENLATLLSILLGPVYKGFTKCVGKTEEEARFKQGNEQTR